MILTDYLERNAKFCPDDTALVEVNPENQPEHGVTWREYNLIEQTSSEPYRRTMTWREFDTKANQFANFLLTRNVKKGDKVAILLMNQLEWLPIYFGTLKTGAIVVPMNYRYTAEEIKYCAELAEVETIVFGKEFVGRIEEIFSSLDKVKDFHYVGKDSPTFADNFKKMVTYCSPVAPPIELKPEDDAAIYFSSGTTGFPKAILHNHESLVTAMRTEQNHHSQKKEDVFLCIPPLYHTGAKMHWFGSLMSAGKAVLLRGVSPEWILETISKEGVTIVWLLVPWAQDLLDAIDSGQVDLANYRLDQLRLMHIGAQPVPPSLIERWMEKFPHHEYDTNYGLSESIGPGCVHLGVENIHKVGAIGKAGYLWETKIVNEEDEECGVDEVGELLVRGPGLMTCYYRNEKATQESLKNGWLYTGDVAKMDEDGFIFLVDRKKDVIISGGENIYPVQIEDFLRTNPNIKDVAVIGIPDDRLGEVSAAVIEVKEGGSLTEEEVHNFCEELPRYKRPREIIFDQVPRNPTGKIEKPVLRKKYCGERLVEAQTKK